MASGRVGGTRSKIRGQVGDVVYQVKRNPDGTYTQIVYGKAEDVTQTITPRLQAQKMCTSMVEALMRDLREVGRVSMQSGVNKSKSLNAFSSFNLRLVAQDCKVHWDSGNQFLYPPTTYRGEPYECLGGKYMISSGTCQFDVFDECLFSDEPWKIWAHSGMITKFFSGVRFDVRMDSETIGHFLTRHRMTVLDKVYFVYFHEWQVYNPEEESYDPHTGYDFIVISVNPDINVSETINSENVNDIFVCESLRSTWKRVSDDGRNLYVGALFEQDTAAETCPFIGAFTISYLEGRKKISSHFLKSWDEDAENYLLNHQPSMVFGSWMGTPAVRPYPNPFV